MSDTETQMINTMDSALQPQDNCQDQLSAYIDEGQQEQVETVSIQARRQRRAAHTPGSPYLFDTVKYMRLGQGFVFEMEMADESSLDNVILRKRNISWEKLFPSMNQYVQMPGSSESIFVSGGSNSDFEKKCYELSLSEDRKNYVVTAKEDMKFARVFHSMCYLDTNTIYVTGSRLTDADANRAVESYDITANQWTTRAQLPKGRSRHASLGFQQRYIFVFCGWVENARSNNILKMDTQAGDPIWQELNFVPTSSTTFEERVCPGVVQIAQNQIAIFGGFGKSMALKDYFELCPSSSSFEAKNKLSEFGMELYYRKACKMVTGDTVFGVDGSCDIHKVVEQIPFFEVIANFEHAVDENEDI